PDLKFIQLLSKNVSTLYRVLYIKVGLYFSFNLIIKIGILAVFCYFIAVLALDTLNRVATMSLLTFCSSNNRKLLSIIKTIVILCSTNRTLDNFSVAVDVWFAHYVFPYP